MNKTAKEYAKFVYDNLSKAKLSNSLNIAVEIQNNYTFEDFTKNLVEVCNEEAVQSSQKSANFVKVIKKYQDLFHSDFNYNPEMITEVFILELCKISRETK